MERGVDGVDKVPRIVQVMYFQPVPQQAAPPNSGQPPDNVMPQQWESQWQEFLKTLQPAQIAVGNLPAVESAPWEDAKSFLSSFEEVAEVCQWPRDEWVGRLLPALRGGVKQCLWRLQSRDRRDYEKVKSAILRDDALRTEARRQQFRHCSYQEGPRRIYRQLQELSRLWLKPDKLTKDQILELIVQEQLLVMLPQEVQRTVKECGTMNCPEMVTLAENFLASCPTTAKMRERPVPEGTAGPRQMEGLLPNMAHRPFFVGISRQSDGEIGIMANEMTSVRNCGVGLPPGGQEMAGAGLTELPVDRTGWPAEDIDQKPLPWQLTQHAFENVIERAPDGLLIPTPDSLSHPEQQETQAPGQTLPDGPLGGRMLSQIKTEDSDETDVDDDMPVLSPAEYKEDASGGAEPDPLRELRPRKQEQGPTRRRRKRGTMKKSEYLANKEKKHKCPMCDHKAYFLSELLRHMNSHSEKRPHRCKECGRSFCKLESLRNHQRTHTAENPSSGPNPKKKYPCGTCEFQAESLEQIKLHRSVHIGEKPFVCTECGQSFRWKSNLSRHRRLHVFRKNLGVRQLMHRGGDGRGKLKNYSLQHYRIRLEDVSAEGRELSVSSRLRPRKPMEQGRFPSYKEEDFVTDHEEELLGTVLSSPVSRLRSRRHQEKGQGASGQLGRAAVAVKRSINYRKNKNHACQQCEYKGERLSDLVKHMRVHTRERPYTCHECGITFRWLSNYNSHKKICTASLKASVPERPVAECDVTLSDEEELINILQKKSQGQGKVGTTSKLLPKGPRPVSRQRSTEPSSKYKNKERKHECLICGHRTFYLSDLVRHQRVHTREKPYRCLQCGANFAQKSTLTSHKKKCAGAPSSGQKRRLKKQRGHREKNYSCSKCGHRAVKLAALLKHMRVHLGERSYKCQECGETFAWQSNLCKHQRTHHPDAAASGIKAPAAGQQETSAGNEEPSRLLVETSPKGRSELKAASVTLPELPLGNASLAAGEGSSKEREGTPVKEPTEAAKGTGDSTAAKAMLKLLNLEKFAYSKGEKSQPSQGGALVANPGISIKEEPCEISVSEKSDLIKSSLMKYQKEEVDEKPHLCADCGSCFPMKAQLSRHQLTPYLCSVCGKTYKCKDALTTHAKTHDTATEAPSIESATVGALKDTSVTSDRTESS